MRAPPLVLLSVVALACSGAPRAVRPGPPAPLFDAAPLAVGFLIIDGVYDTELTAPLDVFHHTVFHSEPGMTVFTVGPDTGPVTTFEGLRLLPDFGFDDAPPIDVLVVPSAEHNMDSDLDDERLLAFVRRAGRSARLVVSLCDGAFLLAAAGLLDDGQQATTFPADIERFEQMFPLVDVQRDVSFVHDGKFVTSAGGALSFEAALYLTERLYGVEVAQGIAAGLCLDWDLADVRALRVEGAVP